MKASDKLNMDFEGLKKNGAINIIALGDSVTHGAFAMGEYDYSGRMDLFIDTARAVAKKTMCLFAIAIKNGKSFTAADMTPQRFWQTKLITLTVACIIFLRASYIE